MRLLEEGKVLVGLGLICINDARLIDRSRYSSSCNEKR